MSATNHEDAEIMIEMLVAESAQAQERTQNLALALLKNMASTSKIYGIPFDELAEDSAKNNPGLGTAEEIIVLAKEEGLI